jgi:ABC-2 type transport system ATP-binding protein
MSNAITASELTRYHGDLLAVDHVSFEVQQGEIFGYLGTNGAGKTTTIKMLTGILRPTEGTAQVNGHDISRNLYQVKRSIGVVPEVSNVYGELTAWDNLLFAAELYNAERSERKKRAQDLLTKFDLYERRRSKVKSYSRRMKRRLTIAMALIHAPAILFLDEPMTALDVQSAIFVRDLIRQLKDEGITVFLTTHYIEEADQLCDREETMGNGHFWRGHHNTESFMESHERFVAFHFSHRDNPPHEELVRFFTPYGVLVAHDGMALTL